MGLSTRQSKNYDMHFLNGDNNVTCSLAAALTGEGVVLLSEGFFFLGEINLVSEGWLYLLLEFGVQLLCCLQAVVGRAQETAGTQQLVLTQAQVRGCVPTTKGSKTKLTCSVGRYSNKKIIIQS